MVKRLSEGRHGAQEPIDIDAFDTLPLPPGELEIGWRLVRDKMVTGPRENPKESRNKMLVPFNETATPPRLHDVFVRAGALMMLIVI